MPPSTPSPEELSRLRQRARQRLEELTVLLSVFLDRAPLLKGAFYTAQVRCGSTGCHCVAGEPHSLKFLAYRGRGRQRNLGPSVQDLSLLKTWTETYRRYRKSRTQWKQAVGELWGAIVALERHRLAEGERLFGRTETGRRLS